MSVSEALDFSCHFADCTPLLIVLTEAPALLRWQAVTGARIRHTGGSRAAHMRKVEAAKARREAAGKS